MELSKAEYSSFEWFRTIFSLFSIIFSDPTSFFFPSLNKMIRFVNSVLPMMALFESLASISYCVAKA